MNIEPAIRYYNVGGTDIRIDSFSQKWLDLMDIYLAIPWTDTGNDSITLELLEAKQDIIDTMLELPDISHAVGSAVMITRPEVVYTAYYDGSSEVRDFNGMGRLMIHYGFKTARIVSAIDNVYPDIYSLVLLLHSAINSLLAMEGIYSVHSACASVNGQGVMISGHSGRGKSTSSMALLKRGHPLVTDERVLLKWDDGYTAYGITDLVKVGRTGVSRFYPELLERQPLYDLEEGDLHFKSSIWRDNGFVSQVPVKCLLLVDQSGEDHSWVEPVNPAKAIGEFLPVTITNSDRHLVQKKFDFLMDFLSRVPCYKLHFGTDMEDFASMVERLVES